MAILAFDFFRNQLKRTGGEGEKNRGKKLSQASMLFSGLPLPCLRE